ncbi:MAG: 3-phosphoserine/phosphohydroxythreonine transaminase [Gammaproteobacteria bacterium]|nr:3-phosphoserine/phosphohydroxythreonine transaminase [Gammaproteobacteria bacterium]
MSEVSRVYNFSAGPATIPTEVLAQAQAELLDWHGCGMSVMEISHRGAGYTEVAQRIEADLRELLSVPDHYRVLFMQGGASSQFSMVPLNLLGQKQQADYCDTGIWSAKAIREAGRYTRVNVCASSKSAHYKSVPRMSDWQLSSDSAYVHITPNETIGGLEFYDLPETGDIPIVADMSSTILSRPIDVSRYGVIYAGAQKNIGPAGLTLIIVREDLLDQALDICPSMYSYRKTADQHSMLNTPPTFAWYLSGLVFQWIKRQGGLTHFAEVNAHKAKKLYQAIDQSDFYHNDIEQAFRSWMNIPFTLKRSELDNLFLEQAAEAGLTNLQGHRLTGGMRASIYNAMPEAGVDELISFMLDFAEREA